jgi:phosphotransferase system enzyme I (PtsI)
MNLSAMPSGSIVVARELFPSDTAIMDTEKVAGLITEAGGATSHVAILANNLGIPAAVGVGGAMDAIRNNDIVVMDTSGSEDARVYVNPKDALLRELNRKQAVIEKHKARVLAEIDKPSVTRDGRAIRLSANVGSTGELKPARAAGAGSIGLYRTEFLFMNSPALPAEEEQYRAYRAVAEAFTDGFVIIRTLDLGGDKNLPALPLPKEDNPSLGNRALRLTLSRPELFLAQLRAILRAGVHGNLKVMFPMVSGVRDLDAAMGFLDEARSQLDRIGEPYDRCMEIGIMVEIPSAVWSAEALARRVSFFSIGTNDLTQYLLAADRLNSGVSDYYRIFDPSVFRSVRQVVEAAESHGRWVGVCGELAGNPLATALLVGLGITELSMSPRALGEASWIIRNLEWSGAKILAERVLEMDTDDEIRALLREEYKSKEQFNL